MSHCQSRIFEPDRLSWVGLAALITIAALAAPARADGVAGLGSGSSQAYRFTQPVPIYRCGSDGAPILDAAGHKLEELAPRRSAFFAIGSTQDVVVISFLSWKNAPQYYRTFNVDEATQSRLIWCVDRTRASDYTEPYNFFSWAPRVGVGLLVVPVKLRLGVGHERSMDFVTDVSLGTAMDLSWRVTRSSNLFLHVPIFAGLGVVSVTPSHSSLAETQSVASLSLGIGLGISGDNVGGGILIGWDIINDNSSIDWSYQGRAWIGISIGTSFGVSTPQVNAQSQPD